MKDIFGFLKFKKAEFIEMADTLHEHTTSI